MNRDCVPPHAKGRVREHKASFVLVHMRFVWHFKAASRLYVPEWCYERERGGGVKAKKDCDAHRDDERRPVWP